MELVKCTIDNKTYNAIEFSKLPDLDKKRKHLECIECGSSAYFRKASKSGQPPSFGSRKHEDNCPVTLEKNKQNSTQKEKKVESIEPKEVKVESNIKTQNEQKEQTLPLSNLSSILDKIISDDKFTQSNQIIEIGNHLYSAKNIFRKSDAITKEDISRFRAIYGQISKVTLERGTIWINFENSSNCSISLSKKLQKRFFAKFPELKKNTKSLIGKDILCFGFIDKKSKFKIEPHDISKIAFK